MRFRLAMQLLLAVLLALLATGCAKKRTKAHAPVPPPRPAQQGESRAARGQPKPAHPQTAAPAPAPTLDELYGYASWYGNPYHGRRTASGEVFNMYDLTAAHKTLTLGTRVEVTNVENGKQVEVRVNDRGPFIEGRIIDLSYEAAKQIALVGPGVALVKLKILEDATLANRRYGVQVGAFQDRTNAERLQSRVSREHVPVEVREEGGLYRVLVGAEPTEAAANSLAQELRRLKLFGMVVLVR